MLAVTRGAHQSVGLVYLAPRQAEVVLLERFSAATAADVDQGRNPELDQIALVGTPGELRDLEGPHVDYLEPVVRRFLEMPGRHEA
ncbi:hypothetical protein [Streptomyces sp. H39-S7]|uniref:hypothetical protein n=1 Tax=Streptomyces sp. H39-S7 TaxID=3004357 RepID=UPI0022AFE4B3|nr:hypothetical protein [Streptomyces sp. H39-S7]MCZ4120296.1 hypothetical protein [Streptomyces sp. H39-S7]